MSTERQLMAENADAADKAAEVYSANRKKSVTHVAHAQVAEVQASMQFLVHAALGQALMQRLNAPRHWQTSAAA